MYEYDASSILHITAPIAIWGAMVHYPVLFYLLLTGHYTGALLTAAVTTLCMYRKNLTRGAWRKLGAAPFQQLGDEKLPSDRPFILLLHPHGIFGASGTLFSWYHSFPENTHLLVAPSICSLSPIGVRVMEALTGFNVSPLTNDTVKELLATNQNLVVAAGGFREASGFHDGEEPLFLHTYPYWLHIARTFPQVSLHTLVIYGGATRWFRQTPRFASERDWLALRNIPSPLITGVRIPCASTPLYYRLFIHNAAVDNMESVSTRIERACTQDLHAIPHRMPGIRGRL